MKIKKLFFFAIFTLLSAKVWGLEVDEKLTTRILKISESKKTVLLNRGLEDGLMVGDHAKLFLTSGVIARGIVVKASPTRSVWSIYRIVDRDQMIADKVVDLKITDALKITEDDSRQVYSRKGQGPINPKEFQGEVQTLKGLSAEEAKDLESLNLLPSQIEAGKGMGLTEDKIVEVWGLTHFNNFSVSSDFGTNGSNETSFSNIDFSLGAELYGRHGHRLLKDFSVMIFYHHSRNMISSLVGSEISNTAHKLGGGINWHFLAPPLSFGRLIGFVQGTIGSGNGQDIIKGYQEGELLKEEVLNGSLRFFSLGLGFKHYTQMGFGLRGIIDYYNRSESYIIENVDGEQNYSKVFSGVRMMLGLSYRF